MGKSGREETALNLCIVYFLQLYSKYPKFAYMYRVDIDIVLIRIAALSTKVIFLLVSQIQGEAK